MRMLAGKLWGKSSDRAGLPGGGPYLLICHLLDTAGVARAVCDLLIPRPMRDRLAQACGSWDAWVAETVLCAGAHDLGKATCWFQQQVAADCPAEIASADASAETPHLPHDANRHAYASGLLLWDHLVAGGATRFDASRVVQIVGGHHGVIPDYPWDKLLKWGGAACVGSPEPAAAALDEARTRMMVDIAAAVGDSGPVSGPVPVSAAAASHAVVVLADWIASSSEFLAGQAGYGPYGDPSEWASRAERRGREQLDRLALLAPPAAVPAAAGMMPAGAAPSPLQASLEASHPHAASGITIITAPTGEGKTEAALLAASRYAAARGTAGWYFAMPTMGTADGLRERLERLLPNLTGGNPPMLHLMHSLRSLRDTPQGWAAADPEARRWMSSSRKAILAPFGVGTIDQALMGVLRVKHSPLRMLAATTGTLIVDEAPQLRPLHAGSVVPAAHMVRCPRRFRCSHVSDPSARSRHRVLQRIPGPVQPPSTTTVCLRSDTRAGRAGPRRQNGLQARPASLGAAGDSGSDSETPLLRTFPTPWHARAMEGTREGGCVMVVRETIAKAQQTYESAVSIKAEDHRDVDCRVVLLHSRFRHGDRRRHTGTPPRGPRPTRSSPQTRTARAGGHADR